MGRVTQQTCFTRKFNVCLLLKYSSQLVLGNNKITEKQQLHNFKGNNRGKKYTLMISINSPSIPRAADSSVYAFTVISYKLGESPLQGLNSSQKIGISILTFCGLCYVFPGQICKLSNLCYPFCVHTHTSLER